MLALQLCHHCLQKTTFPLWVWIIFLSVRLSQKSIDIPTPAPVPARLLPTFHPDPSPTSDGVRKTDLLAEPVHWFKFRVCWYDQEAKMTLWQIFSSKWTFYLDSIKGNYTRKCCKSQHRSGNLHCSWIRMEIRVTQSWLHQSTYSQTSFSAVR